MQFTVIVVLLLGFNLTAFAKMDLCDFDSEFAERYMQARYNYAQHIKSKRHFEDFKEDPNFGKKRSKLFGNTWPKIRFREFINKLFADKPIEIKVKSNGKIIIYPRAVSPNSQIILFDPSGDYFRITKAKIRPNGEVLDDNVYFDLEGKRLERPPKISNDEWKAYVESQTHFRAVP
ncbi:MAG: hypothetical protein AB7I27_07650 [Bacteriovoracaceae bacterium]